jgi:hypothetical protein
MIWDLFIGGCKVALVFGALLVCLCAAYLRLAA